jgi:hypothetical protein
VRRQSVKSTIPEPANTQRQPRTTAA